MLGLDKMSNLAQRVIAGVLGATILINAIYWSEFSFFLLFAFIMSFSLWEFYTLLEKAGYKPMKRYMMVFNGIFLFYRFFTQVLVSNINEPLNWFPYGIGVILFIQQNFYPILFLGLFMIFIVKLYDKNDKQPFVNIALSILGLLYVSIPFIFFIQNSWQTTMTNVRLGIQYQYQIPLGILFCLWASDSGAYFVGRKLGKTKLFERISPKKSWEGFAGGMFFSQIVAFVLSMYFTSLAGWKWHVISAMIVIIGTYGDLVESMLKRSLEIKDSGSVIPGHGGFLDRFDGLLIAMPFVAVFLNLFK
jgi:phosphatidate cytidylyltransferase